MLTILSHRHLYNENGRDVVLAHIAVTTSAELPSIDGIDRFILHEGSKCWDITNSIQYGLTSDGVWHEWESGTSIVTLKGRVDTVNDLPSSAQAGWMYFVGLTSDAELDEYVYTDSGTWERVGTTAITIDSRLDSSSENPVQNKVVAQALNGKVDTISGKGLSTEDYTTAEKLKLAGIEDEATKTIVDTELNGTSENPVQNKAITALLKELSPLYGFKIDKNDTNSDTCVSYTHSAVGMTPAYMDFETGVFNYGSWGNIWFIKEAVPVALKYDGTEDYELDRDDYSLKVDGTPSDIADSSYAGNFMMRFPKVYFKRYEDSDYNYVEISKIKRDEDFKAYAHTNANSKEVDFIYLPLFKGAIIDGKLRSIAGVTPSGNSTAQSELNAASACGDGWQFWDHSSREMLNDLLTLIGKSIASQETFGRGQESGYDPSDTATYGKLSTGTLTDKGMFYGYSSSNNEVKVFGIEGFWGNRFDRVLGQILDNNVWKIKMFPPYNLTGSGYNTLDKPVPDASGYLSQISTSEYGSLPASVSSGGSTLRFRDYFYKSVENIRVAFVGGYCRSGAYAGFRYVSVNALATYSSWNIGASPIYKPLP